MESSRTHFEVLGLGLGLEISSPRKLVCPRLEDSTFFEFLKFCGLPEKKFLKEFFIGERLKNFFEDVFIFPGDRLENCFEDLFFRRTLALVSLVLAFGLEHSCSWPREGLSSERRSLALASDFFVLLALASSLVSSTPPLVRSIF